MLKYWWKILGAVLLVYTVFAGLYFPLRPGLEDVQTSDLIPNQALNVVLKGYNTRFKSAESSMKVYLQDGKQLLPASSVKAVNELQAEAVFNIPAAFKNPTLNLIFSNEKDGVVILNEAVIVSNHMVNDQLVLREDVLNVQTMEPDYWGFPYLQNLYETIRNLFFHVPMWFSMIVLFAISVYHSVKYLSSGKTSDDLKAVESVNVGIVFALLGLITGAFWAKFTWGQAWSFDVKQNFSAIAILLYFAYLVLRNAIDEEQKRAKISAIYNIFAFPMMVVLLFVLPRMSDSLHPGNGGNPGFNSYDLDSHMRMVFYPACLAWILIGIWIYTLRYRTRSLELIRSTEL